MRLYVLIDRLSFDLYSVSYKLPLLNINKYILFNKYFFPFLSQKVNFLIAFPPFPQSWCLCLCRPHSVSPWSCNNHEGVFGYFLLLLVSYNFQDFAKDSCLYLICRCVLFIGHSCCNKKNCVKLPIILCDSTSFAS